MAIELPRAYAGASRRSRGIALPGPENVPQVRSESVPVSRIPRVARPDNFDGLMKAAYIFSAGVAEEAERQQKQFDAVRTTEAQLEFERRSMAEFQRLQVEDDPSRPDFISSFDGFLKKQQDEVLGSLPENVRPEARDMLRLKLASASQGMVASAGQVSLTSAKKKADDTVGQLINSRHKQAMDFPDSAEVVLATIDDDLSSFSGALPPEMERAARKRGREQVLEGAIEGFVAKGQFDKAQALLASDKFAPDLDQASRARATASIERGMRLSILQEGRNERRAAKALQEQGDEYAKQLDSLYADGKLTREEVERRRRSLSPPEYRGFLKLLRDDDAKDDPKTIAKYMVRLDSDDIVSELTEDFLAGRVKADTYRTLVNQNRNALKDDQPASPFKAGRELVNTSLRPPEVLGAGAAQDAARIAQAQALGEWDSWFQANPRASRQQAMEEANAIVSRYSSVQFQNIRISLGLPRDYQGDRSAIKPADLDGVEREVIRKLDSGLYTSDQAGQQLRLIESWRATLAKEASRQTAKKGQQ